MTAPFAGYNQLHDCFPDQWPFLLTFSKNLDICGAHSPLVFASFKELARLLCKVRNGAGLPQ
jgi:hypothetical protein